MRFEIRRVYSADLTIGLLRMRNGRVSVLMGRDYFLELPHGGRPPEFADLMAATVDILATEIRRAHPDARLGAIETTPDLPIPDITQPLWPDQPEYLALSGWLRAGAMA
ncbi:MAG: hypothetical protein Q8O33_12825 [Pseudomonadota bacterium]|nr:hypothetical protein [Pseudomonadota bacterium]